MSETIYEKTYMFQISHHTKLYQEALLIMKTHLLNSFENIARLLIICHGNTLQGQICRRNFRHRNMMARWQQQKIYGEISYVRKIWHDIVMESNK